MPHHNLRHAFAYLEALVRHRLRQDIPLSDGMPAVEEPQAPPFNLQDEGPFTQFILDNRLTADELAILMMALAPHVYPHFFDAIISEHLPNGGDFPAFGGVRGANHRGTIPTGETALYLLAGQNLERRFAVQELFSSTHFFATEKVLYLEETKRGEPAMSGKLILDPDYIDLFTLGKISLPHLSTSFPAQHLTTEMEWNDLVLNEQTMNQIRELEAWVKHHQTLLYGWGMYRSLKPGYRALFYGPPGTGKTLTASLLGKYTGKEVFKVDLSMVISKYIGETEKNLSNLFDKAQNKDWILFFDEADAIFGKRTSVRDAHDKYANQEVAYLLQRIELYPGLTILASNFKDNIDEAFTRRFQSVIFFPIPKPEERLAMWKKAFPETIRFTPDLNFEEIARRYELTGSQIMNIVQYTCIAALDKDRHDISQQDILKGIQREFIKEGKLT